MFKMWLVATGIGAAVTLFLPEVATIAAISIIGLPIAIALLVAPLVFLVSFGAWLVGRRMRNVTGYVLGAGVTLIVLAIPASVINRGLEDRAAAFVADDKDGLAKRFSARAIAVRSERPLPSGDDEAACDGFCMRVLMTGTASQVLFVSQDLNRPLDPAMPALSFRMERRAQCPAVTLRAGHDDFAARAPRGAKPIHELMQLEIAKGNCLIRETVRLGAADAVLSRGYAHRGRSTMAAGLDLFADTVSAHRIAVHVREAGAFREVYRRTGVVTHKLAPVLAPTAEMGAELRTNAVFARFAERRNLASPYDSELNWPAFVSDTLRLDLALAQTDAAGDVRAILSQAFAREGALAPAVPALAGDFLEGIARNRKMAAEDAAIAKAILTDARLALPSFAAAAVRYADDADARYFDDIATAMFARLAAIAARDDGARHPVWADEARAIAEVMRTLPAAALLPRRAAFDWLARQERLRVWAHAALVRLNEFGTEAAPTLLWLIDEGVRLKETYGSDWNNIYVAGLSGLCEMGGAGREMVGPIYERLASGKMVKHASYWDLTLNTLAGMGADPEEMWRHLQTKDKNHTRQRFERALARAARKRDCSF